MTADSTLTLDKLQARLSPWLSRQMRRDVAIVAVRAPGGTGFSAETLLIDALIDGTPRPLVIRFENPSDRSLFMDARIGSQFRTLAALDGNAAIPTPPTIGMMEDAALLGAPFMVVGRLPGRAPSQVPNYNVEGWVADMSADARNAMWRDAIAAMARLHRIEWNASFDPLIQPDLGATGLDQMLAHIRIWYSWANRGRAHPLVETALDRLDRNKPTGRIDGLLWGDASISNMLFDEARLSAVLDWEIAAFGPAEADLAWWLYFQDFQSRGFGHALLPGIPRRDETLAIYMEHSGRPVRDFDYYELLATTRNAILSMRSVNRQIEMGSVPPESRAATHNPAAVRLAEQLGMTPPVLGGDYAAYVAAATRHRKGGH